MAVFLSGMLFASGCTGGSSERAPDTTPRTFTPGGTLRVEYLFGGPGFDPSLWSFEDWEIFRCCLSRTLLSYKGRSASEGGTALYPDLARSMPEISEDLLIWTFHLRRGLHYGPPLADREIASGDLIRGLERDARVEARARSLDYSFYYSVIRGFDEFARGKASSISGLQAPDPHTLKVFLTEPAGDLGYRLSLPAAAPLPAEMMDVSVDAFGRYLVSTGPYMFEGSELLDLSEPVDSREPIAGLTPIRFDEATGLVTGGSATLVRNPSWDGTPDRLRAAYAERIELLLGPPGETDITTYDPDEAQRAALEKVKRGELDVIQDAVVPADLQESIAADPTTADQLHVDPGFSVSFISLNVAAPPFNDIHVRRAFYLAMDRDALRRAFTSGPFPLASSGEIPDHIVPDSVEANLLGISYRPEWIPEDPADFLAASRREMRLSGYDADRDGRCDDPTCEDVGLITDDTWPLGFNAPTLRSARAIGIELSFHRFGREDEYPEQERPSHRWPANANRWAADFPNGSAFFPFLFHGKTLDDRSTFNLSVLGATPRQLRDWGYSVNRVPSVDARIDQCSALSGPPQVDCWAKLDKYLMAEVVPLVPLLFEQTVQVVSPRVVHYSIDQFVGRPAIDQIALTPGSG